MWWLILILAIWLLGLSLLLLRTLSNYNKLTYGISDKTLSSILSNLLSKQDLSQKEMLSIKTKLQDLDSRSVYFIQKIGLVRFNPFSDTGGDQSFSLALMDDSESGMIITSLYARTGVRWYIKTVKRGKGVEHELSKEEAQALRNAMKGKNL